MSITIVCGMNFGDEGKGSVIDYLAKDYDIIARFNGGNNAGHTICTNDKKYVFHLIPSGILHPDKVCIIGNGTVVDIELLKKELKNLHELGVKTKGKLFISNLAHVVTSLHIEKDIEKNKHIGTTGRGIGPCYADKISRSGIRIKDLAYDAELQPYITDTVSLINDFIDKDMKILCEGAQGSLLDVDFGTYPYVTSCNVVASAACAGLGFGPTKVSKVIGVIKAYSTRVGNGPFPTELFDENGNKLREIGKEFGSTTGRPRRCGWLDLPLTKYACKLNGLTEMAITKIDVLDSFNEIKVCSKYSWDGMDILNPQFDQMLEGSPVYETFSGWQQKTENMTDISKFPHKAMNYINFIQEQLNVPVKWVSTGPDRNSIISL